MSLLKRLSLPLLAALYLLPLLAPANPICCHNCHTSGPRPPVALQRPNLQLQGWLARAPERIGQDVLADPSTFFGRIAGQWDDVDGYFTIPYEVAGLGTLEVLIRGFPAQSVGQDIYAVTGWDRSAYWLDTGDGRPRLLQALELISDYVPEPGDYFIDSPDVVSTCTAGAGCTLNLVPYLRYQEFGADYSNRGYIENGVRFDEIQMAFVTDGEGDAIDALVLFEEDIGTDPVQPFQQGDTIFLSILAYKLDEPEYIYALGYMTEFAPLELNASISRSNRVPGEDYVDPDLPADLNAGSRPVRLVLDASVQDGTGYGIGGTRPEGNFAYGGPFPLGFNWRSARSYLHRSGFEALPLGRTAKAGLVRPQREADAGQ